MGSTKQFSQAPWSPRYESDEVAVGVALAIALHALPLVVIVLKAAYPSLPEAPEQPLVSRPVIAATLLKLGQPIDPTKLPDRLVPRARTAPRREVVASRDEPSKPHRELPDAGPPPPRTQESDIQRLISKSDPFAEEGGRDRPEEGQPGGVKEGTETDPSKARAGNTYAALLGSFFHERWQYPTVISQAEANHLCVVMQVAIGKNMVIWHVRQEPIRKSGNELFDDSARSMLLKLSDDRTPLPAPPDEVSDAFRGRTVNIALSGDLHGDASKCK